MDYIINKESRLIREEGKMKEWLRGNISMHLLNDEENEVNEDNLQRISIVTDNRRNRRNSI